MIIYFSATGNTRSLAHKLTAHLNDGQCLSIDEVPAVVEPDGKPLILMMPVHSWGMPMAFEKFLENAPDLSKLKDAETYLVFTCGDDTGHAPKTVRKAWKTATGGNIKAVWSVAMPNTYVLMPGFGVDPTKLEEQKIQAAAERIKVIAESIKKGDAKDDYYSGGMPGFKTDIIYPLFKKYGVNPKKWKVDATKCLSCGLCSELCPADNISMRVSAGTTKEYPEWGGECQSCCACFHGCPVRAIEYGKITTRKNRYRRFVSGADK